ncbi:hypothetical protein [Allosalinactinospora lopnorensis]|uniref:hypothetical protein n=1 Tax=Allosalinactinospora lopnorensis TaxID=1352348 RepID=UPI0009E5828A|nr:hypothetical protein [Allosalinactinospora lopnorensis]
MVDVLSALLPPAVVATVFCTFIIKLLRKEMAPRTSDGRLVKGADANTASSAEAADAETVSQAKSDAVTAEEGAKGAERSSTEVRGPEPGSTDR